MFTGIVHQGVLLSRRGPRLTVRARLARLRTGDSVAVNGVCLTVVRRSPSRAEFDVSPETFARTTLASLPEGGRVNVETALKAGDPLGGHLVSGHVDARARVLARSALPDGCLRLRLALPPALSGLVAVKGSVAVDGVSLTVTALGRAQGPGGGTSSRYRSVGRSWFETVLVPHTLKRSSLASLEPGAQVNLEADMLARYLKSILEARRA